MTLNLISSHLKIAFIVGRLIISNIVHITMHDMRYASCTREAHCNPVSQSAPNVFIGPSTRVAIETSSLHLTQFLHHKEKNATSVAT